MDVDFAQSEFDFLAIPTRNCVDGVDRRRRVEKYRERPIGRSLGERIGFQHRGHFRARAHENPHRLAGIFLKARFERRLHACLRTPAFKDGVAAGNIAPHFRASHCFADGLEVGHGQFPGAADIDCAKRAINTAMFKILWSGTIGDKAPEVRPDTRGPCRMG
jgi:hypothetical protein